MAMKTRPRPIFWLFNQFVFDRVEMNVITVAKIIVLVTDSVLVVAWLPNAASPLTLALFGRIPIASSTGEVFMGEMGFDLSPARGKVIVVIGHRPDAVQVVRE